MSHTRRIQCRGITGFVQVAELGPDNITWRSTPRHAGLHVNILAGLESWGYIEFHSFPIWQYTMQLLTIKRDAWNRPAYWGPVEFDWDKLEK